MGQRGGLYSGVVACDVYLRIWVRVLKGAAIVLQLEVRQRGVQGLTIYVRRIGGRLGWLRVFEEAFRRSPRRRRKSLALFCALVNGRRQGLEIVGK